MANPLDFLAEPNERGPRRVTCKEIEDAFAEGGKVESIEPTRFEVRPDSNDISFGDGGPKAWFALVGEGLMWKAKSQTTQAV